MASVVNRNDGLGYVFNIWDLRTLNLVGSFSAAVALFSGLPCSRIEGNRAYSVKLKPNVGCRDFEVHAQRPSGSNMPKVTRRE